MNRLIVLSFVFFAAIASAQTKVVTPKDSPALQALKDAALQSRTDKKDVADALEKTRAALDQGLQSMTAEEQTKLKALREQLLKDKHYKKQVADIEALQKKIADSYATAQNDYTNKTSAAQQRIAAAQAKIDSLSTVVRQENGFPDTAKFDAETLSWSVPDSPSVPGDQKK